MYYLFSLAALNRLHCRDLQLHTSKQPIVTIQKEFVYQLNQDTGSRTMADESSVVVHCAIIAGQGGQYKRYCTVPSLNFIPPSTLPATPAHTMSSRLSLPDDILHCIYMACEGQDTLASLALTCQFLYKYAIPRVWHTLPCFDVLVYTLPREAWTFQTLSQKEAYWTSPHCPPGRFIRVVVSLLVGLYTAK